MQQEYQSSIPWQHSQEQQHSFAQPPMPAPPPGVAWLPVVANDRTGLGGHAASSFFVAFSFSLQGIAFLAVSHLPPILKIAVLPFSLLLPGTMFTRGIIAKKQSHHWEQIHQHRLVAAAFGFTPDVPLAQPQPVPNLGALPLYSTIKHKANWLPMCALAGMIACASLIYVFWFVFIFSLAKSSTILEIIRSSLNTFNSFPYPYLAPIFLCIVLVVFLPLFLPQRIEVTPEGLAVKHPAYDWARQRRQYKKQVIRWHETRLFAIRGGKRDGSTARYELSGPFTVVTFERILRPRWWLRSRLGQSFGEYNMQMDALLALISAHTGLLLYDVRQHD